ncbi:MAG TPA: nucleotidyltransferase domain-containing protein [bacterium]|nr:nucleotidyltransferase domain-containing protein [bacterium]
MTKSDRLLDDIVATIVKEVSPEKVILFGSHASGTTHPDSDIDLLVVESEPFGAERSRRKETARLSLALLPFRVPIDLLVFARDEIDRWKDSANHVVARALREGRALYERP